MFDDFTEIDDFVEIDISEAYELSHGSKIEDLCNDAYPFLINDILKYIEEMKKIDESLSLTEIIVNYSFKKKIDLKLIGDAISEDEYFKQFIKKDSEFRGILSSESDMEVDW